MKAPITLDQLRSRRSEIVNTLARYGLSNPRVFGSVARGEADSQSDIDLVVDWVVGQRPHGLDYYDTVGEAQDKLRTLLGLRVDVLPADQARKWVVHAITRESQLL
ncbi:MAG: nucleotidyltransferase family protein [Candidatus Dormibacteraceae bacterium]